MSVQFIRLAVALVLSLCAAKALAQQADEAPAPLGLTWGMSKDAVEALGTTLNVMSDKSYGVAAEARNLPKALTDTAEVVLFFGFDDHLWRVFTSSTKWENDRYGSQVRARFEELSVLLSDRYGKGTATVIEPTNEFSRGPENFAMTLGSKERFQATTWNAKGVEIELSLGASFQDTFYTLAYENQALASVARQAIKSREKGAL